MTRPKDDLVEYPYIPTDDEIMACGSKVTFHGLPFNHCVKHELIFIVQKMF